MRGGAAGEGGRGRRVSRCSPRPDLLQRWSVHQCHCAEAIAAALGGYTGGGGGGEGEREGGFISVMVMSSPVLYSRVCTCSVLAMPALTSTTLPPLTTVAGKRERNCSVDSLGPARVCVCVCVCVCVSMGDCLPHKPAALTWWVRGGVRSVNIVCCSGKEFGGTFLPPQLVATPRKQVRRMSRDKGHISLVTQLLGGGCHQLSTTPQLHLSLTPSPPTYLEGNPIWVARLQL